MKRIILNEGIYNILSEARRNPKLNNFDTIVKHEIRSILSNMGSLDKMFMSFRDGHHVTSLNLKSQYTTTPHGLYCYPLEVYGKKTVNALHSMLNQEDSINTEGWFRSIIPWLPPNSKTVYFYKWVGGNVLKTTDDVSNKLIKAIVDAGEYYNNEGISLLNKWSKLNPDEQKRAIMDWGGENTPFKNVYKLLVLICKNHKQISKIFKSGGYDAIWDMGTASIHGGQPAQCVFFTPKKNLEAIGQITIGESKKLKELEHSIEQFSKNQVGFAIDNDILSIAGKNIQKLPDDINEVEGILNVIAINLSENLLSGLPNSFGKLKNIRKLYMTSNRLNSIPTAVFNLSSLQILKLRNNQIQDISSNISVLTNLKNLDISSNEVVNLPKELFELKNLKVLELSNNKLREIPSNIGQLTFLEDLDISQNKIQKISKVFFRLPNIDYITVDEYLYKKYKHSFDKLKQRGVYIDID